MLGAKTCICTCMTMQIQVSKWIRILSGIHLSSYSKLVYVPSRVDGHLIKHEAFVYSLRNQTGMAEKWISYNSSKFVLLYFILLNIYLSRCKWYVQIETHVEMPLLIKYLPHRSFIRYLIYVSVNKQIKFFLFLQALYICYY